MAYRFRSVFRANFYVVWFVWDCVMVKDRFNRVLGLSEIEHCVSGQQIPSRMANGGVPKFLHTLGNWSCQLWMAITFSFELRFACSLSHPDSRPDPIGGSEPVSGTRDSGLGLFT